MNENRNFQPVRGTQSLLGEDADRFHAVIAAFDRVRRLFGFKRVEVPVIEQTAVFARTIGETTDVVSKEMYTFEDRGGEFDHAPPRVHRRHLPGLSAAKAGSSIAPLKVATHGSAFRYERPQKGRFREFHQLDAEIIGAGEPQADVEILCFADQLLQGAWGRSAFSSSTRLAIRQRATRGARRCSNISAVTSGPQRGQPRPARAQPAADPRQQGAPGLAGGRQRAGDRRLPDQPRQRISSRR